jgi:hypothetical protein
MVKQQGKDDFHLEVIYSMNGQRRDPTGSGILYLFMTGKMSQEDGKA